MVPQDYQDRVKAMPQELKERLINAFPELVYLEEKLASGAINIEFALQVQNRGLWLSPETALDFLEEGNIDGIKVAAENFILRRRLLNEVHHWMYPTV
jgi:hypothetical protein